MVKRITSIKNAAKSVLDTNNVKISQYWCNEHKTQNTIKFLLVGSVANEEQLLAELRNNVELRDVCIRRERPNGWAMCFDFLYVITDITEEEKKERKEREELRKRKRVNF